MKLICKYLGEHSAQQNHEERLHFDEWRNWINEMKQQRSPFIYKLCSIAIDASTMKNKSIFSGWYRYQNRGVWNHMCVGWLNVQRVNVPMLGVFFAARGTYFRSNVQIRFKASDIDSNRCEISNNLRFDFTFSAWTWFIWISTHYGISLILQLTDRILLD